MKDLRKHGSEALEFAAAVALAVTERSPGRRGVEEAVADAIRYCRVTACKPYAINDARLLLRSCSRPKRRQLPKSQLRRWMGQPQCTQSSWCAVGKRMRPPAEISLEVASRRSHPWPPMIVENNQATGSYDHLQVIQVDKYVVEHMTAIDERSIR